MKRRVTKAFLHATTALHYHDVAHVASCQQVFHAISVTTETGRLFFLAVKKRIELSPRGL